MSDALLSALILGGSLILFVSERVRHDLVALFALLACLAVGLVRPADAFSGFADPDNNHIKLLHRLVTVSSGSLSRYSQIGKKIGDSD